MINNLQYIYYFRLAIKDWAWALIIIGLNYLRTSSSLMTCKMYPRLLAILEISQLLGDYLLSKEPLDALPHMQKRKKKKSSIYLCNLTLGLCSQAKYYKKIKITNKKKQNKSKIHPKLLSLTNNKKKKKLIFSLSEIVERKQFNQAVAHIYLLCQSRPGQNENSSSI